MLALAGGALGALGGGPGARDAPTCTVPISVGVGGRCRIAWAELQPHLRPTQRTVGAAWVAHKVDRHFSSRKDAQATLDASPVPVALASNGTYLLDRHHTLAALDWSDHTDAEVTVFVSCALGGADDVWRELARRGWAYLFGRPATQPDALPARTARRPK